MNTERDDEITLKLSRSALNVVLQALYLAAYQSVHETVERIQRQALPQLAALAKIAEAEAATAATISASAPRAN